MPFELGEVNFEDGILTLCSLKQSGAPSQVYSDQSARITFDFPASEIDAVQRLERCGNIVLAAAFFVYDGDPFTRRGGARPGAGRPPKSGDDTGG